MSRSLELCQPGRSLPVLAWLAVPPLFVGSVVGLIAAVGTPLGILDGDVSLPTEVFGAAAAVTLSLSGGVCARGTTTRRLLSWGYPLLVLAVGIGLHGIEVPADLAVAVGLPTLALAVVLCLWGRRARDEQRPMADLAR